jgi:hypothetical protein
MEENQIAIESGLRSEMTEEFISGLRNLFAEHYIDVPAEKIDLVSELATKVEELESSLSMAELTETLNAKREAEYSEKKFLAAMQGVDLDKQSGKEDAWEKMKAKVFSGGQAANSNDILAYQGANAQKNGFGIGMGLTYEKL